MGFDRERVAPRPSGDPAIHVNLSRLHEICVRVPAGTETAVKPLDDALIDAFTALDALPPNSERIGFGSKQRAACP